MEEYRFRESDGDRYLIPIEEVKQFDWLCGLVEDFENQEYSIDSKQEKEIYEEHIYSIFDQQFSQYIVEGELFDIPLFINKKDLE
jgi:hypothetical protein